ncbi:MAG: type II toxin-antitoxin system VapB family antitoxin [Trueperaceae bacterium]
MRQFSVKNDTAAELLEQVTAFTGQGKTEAIIHALELYREKLMASAEVEAALGTIRQKVHASIKPEYMGRAPSKAEIETELGMP